MNKVGDARVGFVGFPSVGKSTLLTKLTGTFSEVSSSSSSNGSSNGGHCWQRRQCRHMSGGSGCGSSKRVDVRAA